MPRAVASAMPGEDEPAHVVTMEGGSPCHENAKLERCRSPLRVSYVVFFFRVLSVSTCIETIIASTAIHLLLQASNNAHKRLDASICTPQVEVTAALCTACPPPRPARARIHSSREPSHHRDIAYHLACYKHTRTPQDIGLLRQTPLSTSALSTCARHSAEITLKNGIPRPRIP